MKTKYLVAAAVVIGSGWSSQVTYNKSLALIKAQTSISRAIASESQKDKLTLKNIKDEASAIGHLSKNLIQSKEDLIAELKQASLTDLIDKDKSKKDKLSKIKKIREQLRVRLAKAELFVSQNSKPKGANKKISKMLDKVDTSLKNSRKIVDEFNIVDFEIKLENAREVAEKEKAVEIERNMGDLNSKLCTQDKKIDSLTSKLEKLLKDKEKVVSKIDEKKNDEDKKGKKDQNIASLFNPAFFMNPAQFFGQGLFANQQKSGSNYSFLNNSPAMGGMDMNFLMLSGLLGQNTGMGLIGGGRTSINYSPIYYNNQGYSSPSSGFPGQNFGTLNFQPSQNVTLGMQMQQQQQQFQSPFGLNQNASMIPSFPRSNALQSNNTSTNTAMRITPNAQRL